MVYVTGDTHGALDIGKLEPAMLARRGIFPTAEDYLIICGDVAAVWGRAADDAIVCAGLTRLPWTVLYIDGNHENHAALNALEPRRWHGGLTHLVAPRLRHLMRGQVFELDGMTFFAFGGARSTDKDHRIPGETWWEEEFPSFEQMEEGVWNLHEHGLAVDYIITHTGPTRVLPAVGREAAHRYTIDIQTDFFQDIAETVRFRHWFFGHVHTDADGLADGRFTSVYNSIYRLSAEGYAEVGLLR